MTVAPLPHHAAGRPGPGVGRGRWLISIFQPSGDPAYLVWLDANPNGYVINTERAPGQGPGGASHAGTRRDSITIGRCSWSLLLALGCGAEQPLGFVKTEVPGVAADPVASSSRLMRLEAARP